MAVNCVYIKPMEWKPGRVVWGAVSASATATMSPTTKLALMCICAIAVLVLLTVLKDMLVTPLLNKHLWMRPAQKRCTRAREDNNGPRLSKLAVVVTCNGNILETANQVLAVVRHAFCPFRLHIVVVHNKEADAPTLDTHTSRRRFKSVVEAVVASSMLRGTQDDLNIAQHMSVVTRKQVDGPWTALAAATALLQESHRNSIDHVVQFSPCALPARDWDRTVDEDMEKAMDVAQPLQPRHVVLTHGLVAGATDACFPVHAPMADTFPITKWAAFASSREHPLLAKTLSSMVLAIPLAAFDLPHILPTLSNLTCPPDAADVILSLTLRNNGIVLCHPTRALATLVESENRAIYRSLLRSHDRYKGLHATCTDVIERQFALPAVQQALRHQVGVDLAAGTATQDALLGTLSVAFPQSSANRKLELLAKYGGNKEADEAWKRVRKTMRPVVDTSVKPWVADAHAETL